MLLAKDHRHPGMDPGDEFVWLTGDNCAGVQPLLIRRSLPAFPEACENKGRIVLHPRSNRDLSSITFFSL